MHQPSEFIEFVDMWAKVLLMVLVAAVGLSVDDMALHERANDISILSPALSSTSYSELGDSSGETPMLDLSAAVSMVLPKLETARSPERFFPGVATHVDEITTGTVWALISEKTWGRTKSRLLRPRSLV